MLIKKIEILTVVLPILVNLKDNTNLPYWYPGEVCDIQRLESEVEDEPANDQ